jgi:hypothetical protein
VQLDAQSLIGPTVVALYLKDCLLLLARDEAVLVRGWRGRWRAGFGLLDWRLGGREPWLCHPFKPWQPVLRMRWDAAAPAGAPSSAEPRVLPELALGPWVCAIWLLLFVALPLAFYGHLGLNAVLLVLGELYAVILVSLVLIWRRRAALGLSGSQFGVLAFELLACAPYSANLVRRLSLHRRVDESLLAASERLLDAPALALVRAQCLARIDDELDWIAEDSPRAQALRAARPRFVATPDPAAAMESGHDR